MQLQPRQRDSVLSSRMRQTTNVLSEGGEQPVQGAVQSESTRGLLLMGLMGLSADVTHVCSGTTLH